MKKLTYIVMAALLLAIASCKEKKEAAETESPSQMEQVMAVHDEVMPKMNNINSLISKLEAKIDPESADTTYQDAIRDLKDANKSMMDWMMEFGNHFNSGEIMNGEPLSEEKKQLLNEDQAKMNEVKEKMNGSIERAEALLQN